MPFELEDPLDAGVVLEEVVAGVDEVAAGVDDELLELPPQAVAASAAITSRTADQPRRDRVLNVCIMAPVCNASARKRTG